MVRTVNSVSVTVALLVAFVFPAVTNADSLYHDMSEYRRMPALIQYESYEKCMESKPSATFCVVKTVVKPDNTSDVWRIIEKYSKHLYQYRHSVLTRGVCVENCEKLVSDLNESQRKQFNQKEFDVDFQYITNDWLLPNISAFRQQHGSVINICQNYKLQTEYGLSAFSKIEHCTNSATITRKEDFWDILFWFTLISLVLLSIFSTFCDIRLGKDGDLDYYQRPLKDKKSYLLTAFSFRRNIHRLIEAPGDDQFQRDLGFLDALRVLAMIIVIFSHVLIGERMITSQSPEVVEISDSMAAMQIIAAICPYTVNIFLSVSGFLLAVFFVRYTEGKRFNLSHLWMGIVNRYLRSFPVYLVVMLYTVSVSDLLQYSPSAYQFMVLSRAVCRKKWWVNFLYISNYYQPEELCLIHTWYLSADFQLFVVGLVAMMLIWRFPQSWKWIMGSLFAVGFALPAIRTYIFALDAMMPISNKGHNLRLWYERWYVNFYQTSDVHCASYFAGMFVGIIYHKIRKNEQIIKNSLIFKVLQYSILPLAVAFFLPAPFFNQLDLPKPSLWMGIYAGLHRWTFAITLAVIILMYIFNESGTLFGWLRESRILQNPVLRVSGRLSFSVYLIHMSVLEAVMSNQHEAVRLSIAMMVTVFCSVTMISYALAFAAFVTIEKPLDVIFKQLLAGGSGKSGPRIDHQSSQHNPAQGFNSNKPNLKVRQRV
ncbi:O-acyltransferase like protein-like [Wyeomyia smithii]|uniref:O-acyltransferase like protein-like n=1 Tax=Wyeomyia smithii TaxID=174621 RepID=UPI002467E19D|nr:O-acyltransferase like protein-like [Wyeomyia smithii]